MSAKDIGFKSAQRSIEAREGVSAKSAGAILGAAAKKASPQARKENPRINRVIEAQHGKHKFLRGVKPGK